MPCLKPNDCNRIDSSLVLVGRPDHGLRRQVRRRCLRSIDDQVSRIDYRTEHSALAGDGGLQFGFKIREWVATRVSL